MYTDQFTMDIKFHFLSDILKHQLKHAILSIRGLKIKVFFSQKIYANQITPNITVSNNHHPVISSTRWVYV